MAFTLSLFWGFSEKELLSQAREQSQQQRPIYVIMATISLRTGYYTDSNGNTALAPHNYANFGQGARRDARSGDYSLTLNSESVFGATDLIRGGMSESLVMSELERSYKMIDALNEQNRVKILSGELAELKYDREAIESVVHGAVGGLDCNDADKIADSITEFLANGVGINIATSLD